MPDEDPARVTFTEAARRKVLALLERDGRQGLALRFAADRGPGGFHYRLGFVGPEERREDDRVLDAGGFEVYLDATSAPRVQGASVDFVETLQESGFRIDNPNSPWTDPRAAAVQRLLDAEINPAIASHGGYVVLHDVKGDTAYIEMTGGCQGCGMANVTLRQGIEVRIREAIEGIREIVDVTDHAGGTNPYYAPSATGESPLG